MSRLKKSSLMNPSTKQEIAVLKAISGSRLSSEDINRLEKMTISELMAKYDLDLYMATQVQTNCKLECYRNRAQDLYTANPEERSGYPETPYSKTYPVNEGITLLKVFGYNNDK